jgi:hypothetical protein
MSEGGLYVRNRTSYSTNRSLKNAAKIHVGFLQKGLDNGLRSSAQHFRGSSSIKLRQPVGIKSLYKSSSEELGSCKNYETLSKNPIF